MMNLPTTLLSLMLVAPGSVLRTGTPGHPSVTTRVSVPPRLTVGDRFDVTLVVHCPTHSLVTGPLAESLGVFVVVDEHKQTAFHSGSSDATYRLSMAGFKPGTHRLPMFMFVVVASPNTDTLHSDSATVTIANLLPEKMSDINGLKAAESFPNFWLWLAPVVVLLLAALVWAGRRLIQRLKSSQELAQAPLPPWEEALNALDAMPWREWLEAGNVKRYYYALSEVLKRYIERRFEFQAAEQTTTEMLAAMRAHKTPMRDEFAKFFLLSDLVKYSKVIPPEEEAQSAIDQVREFVKRSMPQEPPPALAAGGAGATRSSGGA